ncbi:MerR family transcriptional regulator [Streptomyces sp. NPDC050085]|uniref:MerR family transcriptional regulator n=1 Tax=Streptomyces sp. NPDC050085 TaxID=3365600 RepID=UPI0037B42D03
MRISEAARLSGASARSLRHYEDEGLIVPGRYGNGYRDYCPSTLDRVRTVRALLDSGLPVRLIREILPDDGGAATGVGPGFLDEVRDYRDRVADRIRALTEQQDALDAYLAGTERTRT